ncbi:MAG: AraC family transcriptional regulator [Chitinophagaceae bacterium]|nr:AraC family transcriptional regulator [Chitinophagaceae bacterium]
MQHLEFFHTNHFENNYHRTPPPPALRQFIDFFWETKFDTLWERYPRGFSDAQFANIGYTYIINLGTPFVMQVDDKKFTMNTDGFLPRYNPIECFHKPGNHLFGIKFRISPVLFIKDINFSEYKEYIFPLSYLLDPPVIKAVKKARTFEGRRQVLSVYFSDLLAKYEGSLQPVTIVSRILDQSFRYNDFGISLEDQAAKYKISLRTLQRYFEKCTGISSKQALQVMRIRKAVAHMTSSPSDFHYSDYGYFDYSHFFKHLKQFMQRNTLKNMQPHLKLLENMHK